MSETETLRLSMEEARGLMLAAQGLLDPPRPQPDLEQVRDTIRRLSVVQIDTISVVERTQYLVLWSRLCGHDPRLLDRLLYPERAVFEYWGHAASILPMEDYIYYRPNMLHHKEHMWRGDREWMERNPEQIRRTLEDVHERGPVASADFERQPDARRTGPWDWHGPKESRRALEILWTTGDLMVHSRRGGQKVYDLRERVLAAAFGDSVPSDTALPTAAERRDYFVRRAVAALGVAVPSWLWDYFRPAPAGTGPRTRATATAALDRLVHDGEAVPATIEGLVERAVVARGVLPDLERLRGGAMPGRTTLLSPFDNLIWDRARARTLFGYEVSFEAYVPPPRRRYGYYCLAILHQGHLVGRLDPKMDRPAGRLVVRSLYLEQGIQADEPLVAGLAAALWDLARFLGGQAVTVDRSDPCDLAVLLTGQLNRGPVS